VREFQPRDLMGRQLRNILAGENDLTVARARIAAHGHHQRGFAGAVGANEGYDLA
jgi:hypothetical protein